MRKKRSEVVRETRQEIASTYRVYRKEWLVCVRSRSRKAVEALYAKDWADRVSVEDKHLAYDDESDTYVLMLKLWNVASEWKREELAEADAAALIEEGADSDEVRVVARNSRDEHLLRSYGKLKLKS